MKRLHGVVSLLDEAHYRLVEDLWAELVRDVGVRGVYVTPFPHFSYHVAEHYDTTLLHSILQQVAQEQSVFRVRTTGLGIFTGDAPVLFIPVVRDHALASFHRILWNEISRAASEAVTYYRPDQWIPHITLGHGDLQAGNLTEIMRLLSAREFNWEITVDNLALIYNTGSQQELRERYALAVPPSEPEYLAL